MPNLAKVFERAVYEQAKLIICPQLSKRAHGFVSNRSVETNCLWHLFYVEPNSAMESMMAPLEKCT